MEMDEKRKEALDEWKGVGDSRKGYCEYLDSL